jgi:hypothetical protein
LLRDFSFYSQYIPAKKIIVSDEVFASLVDSNVNVGELVSESNKDGNPYNTKDNSLVFCIDKNWRTYLGLPERFQKEDTFRNVASPLGEIIQSNLQLHSYYGDIYFDNTNFIASLGNLYDFTIELSCLFISDKTQLNKVFAMNSSLVLYAERNSGVWRLSNKDNPIIDQPTLAPLRNGSIAIRCIGGSLLLSFIDTQIGSSFKYVARDDISISDRNMIEMGIGGCTGTLRGMRIYKRALSDIELQEHFLLDQERFGNANTSPVEDNSVSNTQHLQVLSDEGEAFTLKATRNEQGEATLVVE